jgi:glutaredoxin
MVKEFLSREGHPFETKNIEEDDAAYDELMKLGARSVPVTVIAADHAGRDAQVVTGYDQARLREALTAAGAGSSPDR